MTTDLHPNPRAIRRGWSAARNAERAVGELAEQLGADDLNAMVFFCSASHDLEALGRAVRAKFGCPVAGCTTAGEIVSPAGYLEGGLVGVGFAAPEIALSPVFIPSLAEYAEGREEEIPLSAAGEGRKSFGLLLIDGTCRREELVMARIHRRCRGMPMVGGSAADNREFRSAHVYYEGRFHEGAATLAVFSTTWPFRAFQFQHIEPTGTRLVVTEVDAERRTVSEINGHPAAAEYARLVGVAEEDLSPAVFAVHPVLLRIGGEHYVRSIRGVDARGALEFCCAVEAGMVLTLGASGDLTGRLKQQLKSLCQGLPGTQVILGFDCILRRVELEQRGDLERMAKVLAPYPFIGFSTFGEQYGGIHVNQTLTGLAIGGGA